MKLDGDRRARPKRNEASEASSRKRTSEFVDQGCVVRLESRPREFVSVARLILSMEKPKGNRRLRNRFLR